MRKLRKHKLRVDPRGLPFASTTFAMIPVTTCRRRHHHALFLALCVSSVVDSLLIATSLHPPPATGRGYAGHDIICATCSHGHVASRRNRCEKIGKGDHYVAFTHPSLLLPISSLILFTATGHKRTFMYFVSCVHVCYNTCTC